MVSHGAINFGKAAIFGSISKKVKIVKKTEKIQETAQKAEKMQVDETINETANPPPEPTPDQGKIFWHDPFFEGLKTDLRQFADVLEYQKEYELSQSALKIDVVITKKTDEQLQHDLARIFKKHNLIEYKSEKDNFSKWDYHQISAYVNLYAAANEVSLTDMTMTVVLTQYPQSLKSYLRENWGVKMEYQGGGITYVPGEKFSLQIVESRKLSKENNLLLSYLRSNLTPEESKEINEVQRKLGWDIKNIYYDRISAANRQAFKEAMSNMSVFEEIYLEVGEESGILPKRYAKVAEQATLNRDVELIKKWAKKGMSFEQIADFFDLPIENVRKLEQQ